MSGFEPLFIKCGYYHLILKFNYDYYLMFLKYLLLSFFLLFHTLRYIVVLLFLIQRHNCIKLWEALFYILFYQIFWLSLQDMILNLASNVTVPKALTLLV